MKYFTKKQTAQFNKEVEQLLLNYSATKIDSPASGFRYELMTDAGMLEVHCSEPDKSSLLSIFLRFADYDKAVAVLGVRELGINPKWNIHCSGTIEETLQYLNYKLTLVNAVKYIPANTTR